MKIFIQHTKTKKFLKGVGVWTDQAGEALFFNTTAAALTYYRNCKMQNLQLVNSKGERLQTYPVSMGTLEYRKSSRLETIPEPS